MSSELRRVCCSCCGWTTRRAWVDCEFETSPGHRPTTAREGTTEATMRQVPHLALTPTDKAITITCDDRDATVGGNMSHDYNVRLPQPITLDGVDTQEFRIHFQRGPIAEVGVNGLTNEALLAIVIDRLAGAQEGPFKCRENTLAITKIEEASLWLAKRTLDRMARGVEGQSKA